LVELKQGGYREAVALVRHSDGRLAQQSATADALAGISWRWNFTESELRSFRDSQKTAMQSEITGALVGYGLGAAFFATTMGVGNIALAPYGEHLLRPARTKYASHVTLSKAK